MQLNCDLGEGYGNYSMPVDEAIMPYLHQANIACGFHAGDPLHIKQAVALAIKHGVSIGAHPSYPDLQGFGRRSMAIESEELIAIIQYQIGALHAVCQFAGSHCQYVKPHGALYHDIVNNQTVRLACFSAIAATGLDLPVMLPATQTPFHLVNDAEKYGLKILFEAFADRAYLDSGLLAPRHMAGSVLDVTKALAQAKRLINHNEIVTISGQVLPLYADSLCVHSDSPEAVLLVQKIAACL